jgi:FkbM family methyltransferase
MSLKLEGGLEARVRAFSAQVGPYVEIFLERVYERHPGFVSRPGDIVLDVGANVGFFTLRQAQKVGPTGKVFAFEPNPSAYELLVENINHNGFTWVSAINAAMSDRGGQTATFWVSQRQTSTGSLFRDHGRTGESSITSRTIKLDDFVARENLDRIDLLKMDTEGAEALIIEGGLQRAVPITRRIVMESHNTRQPVEELLRPFGFSMVHWEPDAHVAYFARERT